MAGLAPRIAAAQASAELGAHRAATGVRVMHAARRTGPIVIDGRLDEPAWRAAPVAGDFTQSYPNPGAAPVDSTRVRVLYDDAALYVGIRMYDAHPDSIAAQLARRDASGIYSDWVHLVIDSYHDRRTAFRFSVNPRGVEKDVYTSNDGNEDLNWDAVWEVGTRIDSLGWVAEYRIPLSQLRFGPAPASGDRLWGIQVMRDIARRNERDSWSPWTPQSPGFVSRFGDLTGLRGVSAPERLEVVPYASTRVTRAPGSAADPFYRATNARPSVGADVRYGLPAGLTLTATVNPDFGQVEVDPAVVNLSAFETFFPEKRPFFLEGADIFDFGAVRRQNDFGSQYFFYSRRIGRAPELSPYGPGVRYADSPDQTTIAGAAKVTGKAGPWSVGFLDAVTTQADARVALTSGARATAPVEPLTNYFAGRVKRDFRQGASFIGAMLTSTVRGMSDSVFQPVLRDNATLGGVDFEHGMQHRNWIVSGFLAGSRVEGSARAIDLTQRNSTHYLQRPDASYLTYDPTRTSLSGYEDEIALQKSGNLFGSVAYKEMNPTFEINDLGFVGRGDYRAVSNLVGYQDYQAGAHLRSYNAFIYTNDAWNFGGTPIYRAVAGRASVTNNSLWTMGAGFTRELGAYSDRLLRGGPLAQAPAGWTANGNVTTDSRWPVIITASGSYSRDVSGAEAPDVSLSFDMRPSSTVHVSLGPELSVGRATAQYLAAVSDPHAAATYGARYVFANLRQTTLSMDTRVEWTLTPQLSLQSYLQPFVSSGAYASFKEFTTPGAFAFAVYGRDRGTIAYDASQGAYTVDPDGAGPSAAFAIPNPNFNVRSLRGNAVLRWEYRPGSVLYLVWQQQRSGYAPVGDFETGRDLGAIFRTAPTNVFLLKATYWIGH
ncbi:MAG: carbohydrate binding family 9 domain-containing protein [Gemmatimonadota bacterium]|nr:carbohydrate binding family 9 domain-containing protein [Gemmatimonadota bacterium]